MLGQINTNSINAAAAVHFFSAFFPFVNATKQLFIFGMKSITQRWWKKVHVHHPKSPIILSILCLVEKFAWQQQQHQHCSAFHCCHRMENGELRWTHTTMHVSYFYCSMFLFDDSGITIQRITSRRSIHSWKYMKMINLPYIRNMNVSRYKWRNNTSPQQVRYESKHFQQNVDEFEREFGKLLSCHLF